MIPLKAKLLHYSENAYEKDGIKKVWPTATVRVGGKLFEIGVKSGLDLTKYTDKEVLLTCEFVTFGKDKRPAVQVVDAKEEK